MRQTDDCCSGYVYFNLDVKIRGIYARTEFVANFVRWHSTRRRPESNTHLDIIVRYLKRCFQRGRGMKLFLPDPSGVTETKAIYPVPARSCIVCYKLR